MIIDFDPSPVSMSTGQCFPQKMARIRKKNLDSLDLDSWIGLVRWVSHMQIWMRTMRCLMTCLIPDLDPEFLCSAMDESYRTIGTGR
jgi:hypothetical protein